MVFVICLYVLAEYALPFVFPESPWAYTIKYDTKRDYVRVTPKPGDCDFLHAPIGLKGCHYETSIQVTRYSKDVQSGRAIVSYDDGKTWSPVPADEKSGPTEVYVGWDRVADTR